MNGIIDFSEYIGKEFVYESKYGGCTKGVVANIFHNSFSLVDFQGNLYKKFNPVRVRSTNGIFYDLDEIIIKLIG